ncbi:hypothetical protein D3C80_1277450 [compost metagenome]
MAADGAQGLQPVAAHADVVSQVLELLAQQDLVGMIVIHHQYPQPGPWLPGREGGRHLREIRGGQGQGQFYLEAGPPSRLAVDAYLSSHHLAQDAGQVQAKAAARVLLGGVCTVEGGEQLGQLVRRDADPGV